MDFVQRDQNIFEKCQLVFFSRYRLIVHYDEVDVQQVSNAMVFFVLVYHCVEAVIEVRVENFLKRVLLKRRKSSSKSIYLYHLLFCKEYSEFSPDIPTQQS